LIHKYLVEEPLSSNSVYDEHFFEVVIDQSSVETFKRGSTKKQVGDTIKIGLDDYGVRINWRDSLENGLKATNKPSK